MIDLEVLCPPGPITERDWQVFRAGAEFAMAHMEMNKGLPLRERVRAVKRELRESKGQKQ